MMKRRLVSFTLSLMMLFSQSAGTLAEDFADEFILGNTEPAVYMQEELPEYAEETAADDFLNISDFMDYTEYVTFDDPEHADFQMQESVVTENVDSEWGGLESQEAVEWYFLAHPELKDKDQEYGLSVAAENPTAARLIAKAEEQLGIGGRPNKFHDFYGALEGGKTYAWCHIFLSWLPSQFGIGKGVMLPHTASCALGCEWFTEQGRWHSRSSGYTPQPGDFVYFNWPETTLYYDHVALVTSVADGYFHTIEGNISDKVVRDGMVREKGKGYAISDTRIIGYGTPYYGTAESGDQNEQVLPGQDYCNCTEKEKGFYKVISRTENLKVRAKHNVNSSILEEMEPGTIIYVSKTNGEWGHVTYNGVSGYSSMEYLEKVPEPITEDQEKPVISDLQIVEQDTEGFTLSVTVTDESGIREVLFPTWTETEKGYNFYGNWWERSQVIGTAEGNTYQCRILFADHEGNTGTYFTRIYAIDNRGNVATLDFSHIVEEEHEWVKTVAAEATYIEPGILHSTCTICGISKVEEIPVLKIPAVELKSVSSTEKGVILEWTPMKEITKYKIYRRKPGDKYFMPLKTITDISIGTWTDTTIESGQMYEYKMKAVWENGEGKSAIGAFSVIKSGMIIGDVRFTSVNNVKTGISLNWTTVYGTSGYCVYRRVKDTGSYEKVAIVNRAYTSWVDLTAKNGVTYQYVVQPYFKKTGENTTYGNKSSVLTYRRLVHNNITDLKKISGGIQISWKKATGNMGYLIYRQDPGDAYFHKVGTVRDPAVLTWTDTTAKQGVTYSYKVKNYYKEADGTVYCSKFGNILKITA